MSNIRCEMIRDLLPLYADHVISDVTRDEIDKHLQECSECWRIYDAQMKNLTLPLLKEEIKKEEEGIRTIQHRLRKEKINIVLVSCALVAAIIGIILFSIYRSSGEWTLKTSSSENIKSEMIRNHPETTKIAFSDWYGQNLKVSFHSDQDWFDETVETIIQELSVMLRDDTFQEEYFKVYKSRYGKTETERMNAVICFYSRSDAVYKFQYMSVYPFEEWSVRKYE